MSGDGLAGSADLENSPVPTYSRLDFTGDSSVASIEGGPNHTCAILTSGRVYCWGSNAYKRMGINSHTNPLSPPYDPDSPPGSSSIYLWPQELPLASEDKVVSLSADDYTCLIRNNGTVKCVGTNYQNPLDDHPTGELDFGVQQAVSIAVGIEASCALLGNGEIRCWGNNFHGILGKPVALGRNTDESTMLPETVNFPEGKKALSLSLKDYTACALLEDGEVYCWGGNKRGQVGIASDSSETKFYCRRHFPNPIDEDGNFIDEYSELYDSSASYPTPPEGPGGELLDDCAVDNSRKIYALPTKVDLDDIVDGVSIKRKALAVSMTSHFSCAILDNKKIKCWGGYIDRNTDRINEIYTLSGLPEEAEPLSIAGGGTHLCVFLAGGDAYCAGNNLFGQLGNITFGDSHWTQFQEVFQRVRLDLLD